MEKVLRIHLQGEMCWYESYEHITRRWQFTILLYTVKWGSIFNFVDTLFTNYSPYVLFHVILTIIPEKDESMSLLINFNKKKLKVRKPRDMGITNLDQSWIISYRWFNALRITLLLSWFSGRECFLIQYF